MGWLGPILDSKLIPVAPFFTAAIAGHMNYEHQKLDKMIFQQPEHSIYTRKYPYHFY